jgi:cell division septation protein DedD
VAVTTARPPAVEPPAPPVAKVAVPKKVEKPAAAAPVAAAPVTKTTGAGYMAVLASVPATDKSRMDALKQFADLQQKYGSALAGRTPDVQEANLGEKGTYHRLLAGPPVSREQASALCSQLKAAGYTSCWVTAY